MYQIRNKKSLIVKAVNTKTKKSIICKNIPFMGHALSKVPTRNNGAKQRKLFIK